MERFTGNVGETKGWYDLTQEELVQQLLAEDRDPELGPCPAELFERLDMKTALRVLGAP